MTSREPSIVDVARAAGVSKSTASRALLGGSVTEQTRRAVEAAADELGYVKNSNARAMRTRPTTIGVLVRAAQMSFYGELVAGLQAALEPAGHPLVVVPGLDSPAAQEEALRTLLSMRVSGLILASGRVPLRAAQAAARSVPVVFAGRSTRGAQITSVSDDPRGADALADLVAELGHTRVGVATVARSDSQTRHRRTSRMVTRLRSHGLEPVELPLGTPDRIDPGAVTELAGRASAIMLPNDPLLLQAWAALEAAGLRVPHDVSLTGYDGVGELASPALGLTTWRQDLGAMAKVSVDALLSRLADPDVGARHVVVRGSLQRGRTLSRATGARG